MVFQELLGMLRYHIAGDEEKALAQRIAGLDQRLIEMLSVKPGHFHIANDEVIRLAIHLLQGLAAVELHIYLKALILQNIRNQPRDGWFVFHDQNAAAVMNGSGCRQSWTGDVSWPGFRDYWRSVDAQQVGSFGYAAGCAQGDRKNCSTVWRARNVYMSSMLPHDA